MIIAQVFLAFACTAILLLLFRRPAIEAGLVDRPCARKRHGRVVPLIGGLCILFGFFIALLPSEFGLRPFEALFTSMTMLLVVGVVDDLIDIEARIKLFFQVAAALLITLWGGLLVSDLGWLLGPMLPLELGWLALPFTVLCIVGLINAVNMFDGLDGLAGGSVAIALAWLALAGFLGGGEKWPILALLLCAAICAFLVFNARNPWRRRAASFLGDSGSMMLGVALAWFALEAGSGATAVLPPITVAWILALPVLDALILFGRRLVRRRSPFKADREHLHHTLTRAGLSHGQIVALLLSVGALWGGIGFAGAWFEVPEKWLATGLLAVALMHTLIHVRAWRFAAFLRRYSRRSGGR